MATLIKTIKERLTDDTIYPVTKASAVYLNDNETTVEGLLGNSSLNTDVQTVTGAINEINTNLNTWIVNKPTGADAGTAETEGYFVRMGVDKDGSSSAYRTVAPFAYIDFMDGNDNNRLLANLIIAGPQTENQEEYHDVIFTSKGIRSTQYSSTTMPRLAASLADMVPDTSSSQHFITTQNQLDNELHPGWLYSTSTGTSLGLPMAYCVVYEYWYSANYRFQIAQMVNTQKVYICARSQKRASGATTSTWGPWYTIADSGSTITVTPGTGMSSGGYLTQAKNGIGIINLSCTIAAGTYTGQSFVLFTVSIPPVTETRATVAIGTDIACIIIRTNGQCVFNNSVTIPTGGKYILGQIVYSYQ